MLINKPEGITSSDVINRARAVTGIKKIGHSGTLDRFASGLLVLCTGWATKLTRFFLESDKKYSGRVKLGAATDTDDAGGSIIATGETRGIERKDIEAALEKFRGTLEQVPPVYSALKVNGRRASDLAREGTPVEKAPRKVEIFSLALGEYDGELAEFDIEVHCSKGTYIRSLARDIGKELGTGAHLVSLCRQASGRFTLDRAVTIEGLAGIFRNGGGPGGAILSPAEALRGFSSVMVEDRARERVLNGAAFDREDVIEMEKNEEKRFIILDKHKNLIAIAGIDTELWKIIYYNVIKEQ